MLPEVAFRRDSRNSAPVAVSAPSKFVVIASRVLDLDRLEVALRGEHDGTFAGAKRHAKTLARAVAERFGFDAVADVVDHETGLPLFSTTAGGVR